MEFLRAVKKTQKETHSPAKMRLFTYIHRFGVFHLFFSGSCPEPGGVVFAKRHNYTGPYNIGCRIVYTCTFAGTSGTKECGKNKQWMWKPRPDCAGL